MSDNKDSPKIDLKESLITDKEDIENNNDSISNPSEEDIMEKKSLLDSPKKKNNQIKYSKLI